MADRFPLILNTNINQIQEIASGDNLDLTGSGIHNAGVITATSFSGPIVAGAGVSNITSGIGTFTDLRVGGDSSFSEDLVVTGNARVTGILTVGTSSIILNDSANTIKVGTALTLGHTQGLQFHTQNLHSTGFEVNQINASGIITATGADINGDIDVDGHTNLDNVSIAGVTTFAGAIDANGDLDVDGHTNLDNVSIAGVTTISGNVRIQNASPILYLTDTGNNPDYQIKNNNGYLDIFDETNSATRLSISNTGAVTTGDHITLSGVNPRITFTDSNHNPDFEIYGSAGNFKIWDSTSNVGRLVVNSDGHIDIPGNLDCGAGIDVTGNVIASGNVTGVNGVFSGNVSVGGVLTYEDVTNVDSVGIITARSSIKVTNASANAGNYLEIKTNANSSSDIIKAGTGAFFIKGHNVYIGDDDSNKVYMGGEKDGKSFLKFNNSTKIETTNTGVVATGIMTATSFSGGGLKLKDDGADSPILSVMADDGSPWAFQIGNSTYHDSMSTGTMIYNADTGVGYFQHRGNSSYKEFQFTLNNGTSNHRCIVFEPSDQSVELYCTNNKKLETTSSGVSVSGSVIATGNMQVNDNNYLYLGNSGDLNLRFLNGTGAFIQSGGNSMFIRSNLIELGDNSGNKYIKCVDGAQVELYHGVNSKRLETTSTGVTVSGSIVSSQFGSLGNASGVFGRIRVGADVYGNTIKVVLDQNMNLTAHNSIAFNLGAATNGSDAGSSVCVIVSDAFRPTSNNTKDLGTTTYRWRNIYTNDLNLSNKGKTNDVDNTWGDYTIQEGESDLFLINNRSGKKYKFNLTEVS